MAIIVIKQFEMIDIQHNDGSISFAAYPSVDAQMDNMLSAENNILSAQQLEYVTEVISALRNVRQTLGISWSNQIELHVEASGFEAESIKATESYIKSIAKVSKILIGVANLPKPVSTIISRNAKIQIPLAGLVDLAKLRENVDRKIANLLKDINGLEQRLSSENFVKNAAPDKVVETKEALEKLLSEKLVYEHEILALS